MSSKSLNWGVAGILLTALHLAQLYISPQFAYEQDNLSKPILTFVGIEIAAGAIYLFVLTDIHRVEPNRSLLIWVIVVGAILRALIFASTPVLEDDFYRYLWNGAVMAQGVNPYSFSPDEVSAADEESSVPASLHHLGGRNYLANQSSGASRHLSAGCAGRVHACLPPQAVELDVMAIDAARRGRARVQRRFDDAFATLMTPQA